MSQAGLKSDAAREAEAVDGSAPSSPFPTISQVCEAAHDFLGTLDIAALNLICVSDLPGGEVYSISDLLKWIDDAARKVRLAIDRNSARFLDAPAAYDNSYAKFSILYLITVLQRECGVRYNPKWQGLTPHSPTPEDFGRDANDGFIHAIINGIGGTCGSLPVLYVAVGRRLGYPLKLVKAFRHLFVRWDDPKGEQWFHADRFNIEATGPGVHFLPDEHYKTWPHTISDEDIRAGLFLKSLSPREELAEFVATRGYCLQSNGRLPEAIEALGWASQLAPQNHYFAQSHRVLSMHLMMRRRGHAFLNAPVVTPFGQDEWPTGPQWIRGRGGHEVLVQVFDPWQSPPLPAQSPPSVGHHLTSHTVQLPNGRMVEAQVPSYHSSHPMQASWAELPGGKYALVHQRVDPFSAHLHHAGSGGHNGTRAVKRNGQPILPDENDPMSFGYRAVSGGPAPGLSTHDHSSLVQELQQLQAARQFDATLERLPPYPVPALPPGPFPARVLIKGR